MKAAVTRFSVERFARVPFSVAHEYAAEFFRHAERSVEVRLRLRDLFWVLRGTISKRVQLVFALHPDEEESGRLHDAVFVEWTAGMAFVPRFHGTLRMRIAGTEMTRLRLEAAYRRWPGPVGLLCDRVVWQPIARSTVSELLDRLAHAMERAEESYRAQSGVTA
ncbi:MAG TPA: hypothetical protein VE591_13660 [Candidatus Acidoferrum sp.]|jgi:hypothetical protein|nr:hypothetical protein [Candidatus Acidoferrum sp.]